MLHWYRMRIASDPVVRSAFHFDHLFMFDFIRTHQRLAQGLLLILILPSFVFFGIAGYDQFFSDADSVASVDGEPISRHQYEQVQRQQMQQAQQMLGENFDAAMLDTPQARAQVLEDLITRQAMYVNAREHRLVVTPAEIQKQILDSHQDLRDDKGKFDVEAYRRLLTANGLTPQQYEAQIGQQLAMGAVERAIGQSSMAPKTVVDALFAAQENRRVVRTMLLAPKDREKGLNPSDEQLKAYYDSHGTQFDEAESVDISYVVLRRDDVLAADAAPSDKELQAYYQTHRGRFNQPAEREASHILLKLPEGGDEAAKAKVRERAEALLKEARANPDGFAELAKKNSEDTGSASSGGSLGYFERDTMVKPFADAVFALEEPGFTDVVESEFGFHVIKVTGIKGSGDKPLAEVRNELLKMWREEQAAKEYNKEAETLSNLVYEQADSLQPAAERYKLKIEKASKVGRRPAPGAEQGSVLASTRLLDQLFSPEALEERRNTTAIEVAPGVLVSARVDAHNPKRRPGLDEIRDQVKAAWVAQEAVRLTKEAGEKELAALKDGSQKKAPDLSPENTVSWALPGRLQASALRAVFGAPVDSLPAWVGADLGNAGYQLIRVEKALPPDEAGEERRGSYAQQVNQLLGASDMQSWISALKSSMKIERRLDNLTEASDDQ